VNRTWIALVLMMLWAVPGAAQNPGDPDEEGCTDSKLLTRMPGCQLYACSTKDFDEAELVVGPPDKDSSISPVQRVEGAVEFLHYVCPAKYSSLQIARNAENALKKAGFAVVFSGKADDGYPVVTMRKGPQWVQVRLDAFNEYSAYRQTAVLLTDMEQALQADASAMAAEVQKSGSVAVYGITFDTGSATLQAGSEQVLAEVAKLMKERPDWRFEVQGHTDNVGQKAANMTLSEQRARAVVAWLTQNGIEGSRLVAKGYGDTQPVADNATEEGRARNRRVELKKLDGR